MTEKQKVAKDLTRGDFVLSKDNEWLRVEAVDKGFWPGSLLVTWFARTIRGTDWSCINRDAVLTVRG